MGDFPTGGPVGVTQPDPAVMAIIEAVKERLVVARVDAARISGVLAERRQMQDLTRQLLLIELLQTRDASSFNINDLTRFMAGHRTMDAQQYALERWATGVDPSTKKPNDDLTDWALNAPPNVSVEPDTYSARFPEKPAILVGL